MATIQAKTSRGHKYWYIVESRRVNGKPRPIVLAYLGKPEDLLRRLHGLTGGLRVKSYSHGAVAALLDVAARLQVPALINPHVASQRAYVSQQPVRNHLTVGITLVLAAIGRACQPTSKRGWWQWARTTSCEFLLRASLAKVDSQHFWDLMDCLPMAAIPNIEVELVRRMSSVYGFDTNTLAFDTTNFYTYIDSGNAKCTIARRGNNKQKRHDLRQIGLALVVTRKDFIPLFHQTYQGNRNDCTVFEKLAGQIRKRLVELNLDLEKHTLVFDRGNNSISNLRRVTRLKLHYVGALTPANHQDLIADAARGFQVVQVGETTVELFRDRRTIWGEERTVLVFVSAKLRSGQLRGIYQTLDKKKAELRALQRSLSNPRARKHTREALEAKIASLLKGQYMDGLIRWTVTETSEGRFTLTYRTNTKAIEEMEDELGLRILMTDRHDWSSEEIVQAFHGQSAVESAFKNMKNPYHLAARPGFHWTDQKIEVHHFSCVLAYQLAALIWRDAKLKAGFRGNLDTLFDTLNNIRLATLLEQSEKPGKVKTVQKLEEMTHEEQALIAALGIADVHLHRPQIDGVSVYDASAT
jgi:transposase